MTPEQLEARREKARLREQARRAQPGFKEKDRIYRAGYRWRPERVEPRREQSRRAQKKRRQRLDVMMKDQGDGQRYRERPEWKEQERGYRRKYLYGITNEQWHAMFAVQGARCAICKSLEPHCPKGWKTDHCHATNRVRGILCADCNRLVHDRVNADILHAAAAYISAS